MKLLEKVIQCKISTGILSVVSAEAPNSKRNKYGGIILSHYLVPYDNKTYYKSNSHSLLT